jgi:hypothetical protein
MADFNLMFLVLLILVLGALGVANFVEARKSSQVGQPMFGLLYLVFAVGLIVYKIQNP